jgi:cobalt-precorrin 5A hydrolase
MGGHQTVSGRIAIGVGCRKGCSADAIETLIHRALTLVPSFPRRRESMMGDREGGEMDSRLRGNDDPFDIAGLFTLVDKQSEAGLAEAAKRLDLTLTFLSRETLRAQAAHVQTAAPHAEAQFGVPSVAESAALAGAGPDAVLIVSRIAADGATCAIAGVP